MSASLNLIYIKYMHRIQVYLEFYEEFLMYALEIYRDMKETTYLKVFN